MKIYNTMKPPPYGYKNFNLLPFISLFDNGVECFLNIGWLFVCISIVIR